MKKYYSLIALIFAYAITNAQFVQKGNEILGTAQDENVGSSVSFNENGNIMAYGAIRDNGGGNPPGYVKVFEYVSDDWVQLGNTIDGINNDDQFGKTVCLNASGTILAVSDPVENSKGVVRVYELNGSTWNQLGNDIVGDIDYSGFGRSLSFNYYGDILAIGASYVDSGYVKIYQYSAGSWTQIGSTLKGYNNSDYFGYDISLNTIGDILVVGAPQNEIPNSQKKRFCGSISI